MSYSSVPHVFKCCKQANSELGLRVMLYSRGVIQRKERGLAKWQLAAYNHVHNKIWQIGSSLQALAVWNKIKPILLAKEDELGD